MPWDELLKRFIEQPSKVSIKKLAKLERKIAELEAKL
jgi:predicted RNA-binding protein YlqC (UPF0109 family)